MNRVWKNIFGYVIISVDGFGKERFLNICRKNGLILYNLKYSNNCMIFATNYRYQNSLFEIAEKTGCVCRVLKLGGLPVLARICKRHFMFLVGFVFFICAVEFASSFVWQIEVTGNSDVSDSEIISVCKENGIFVGTSKKSIDYGLTAENIKNKFDNISWANITSKGTRVTVRVSESRTSTAINSEAEPCDITADEDCIITEIIAEKGMPVVRVGDSVCKGDLLVSGTLVPVGFEENREETYTHSTAIIRGRVVKNIKITQPLQFTEKIYTGKKCKNYNFVVFDKNFNINFIKNVPKLKKYDIMKEIRQLKATEERPLPFYIVTNVCREYKTVRRTLTEEEAQTKAAAGLIDYIAVNYPVNSDIISTRLNFERQKSAVVLSAEIVCERDIGKSVPLTLREENGFNGTAKNADSQ